MRVLLCACLAVTVVVVTRKVLGTTGRGGYTTGQ